MSQGKAQGVAPDTTTQRHGSPHAACSPVPVEVAHLFEEESVWSLQARPRLAWCILGPGSRTVLPPGAAAACGRRPELEHQPGHHV